MKYYIRTGDAPAQLMDESEIAALAQKGGANARTHACPVGAQSWSTLGQLLPHLFGDSATPPPPPTAPPMANAGNVARDLAVKFAGKAKSFAHRILMSNFTVETVLPDESAALEKAAAPVKARAAQNYAAWRRAMLWFSGVGLAVGMLVDSVEEFKNTFIEPTLPFLRFILIGLLAIKIATPTLLIRAALRWTDIRASRKDARRAVFLTFVGPLLLLLIPVVAMSAPEELRKLGLESAQHLMGFRIGLGLAAVIFLLPHFLGLFPGIIRACMTLRTLVPESPLPGIISALILPLFTMLLLIPLIVAAQAGSALLFLGFAGMLCLPVMLLRKIRLLLKPMDGATMNAQIGPLRKRAAIAWDIGLVLILVEVVNFVQSHQLWDKISILKIISFATNLLGIIILVTLAGTDFLLGLMKYTFEQDKELHGTSLHTDMEARFQDLDQARMTQYSESPPPPPTA